jgi:hypothetical protein
MSRTSLDKIARKLTKKDPKRPLVTAAVAAAKKKASKAPQKQPAKTSTSKCGHQFNPGLRTAKWAFDKGKCLLCGEFEPRNKWAYKPGQSGNPSGRPKGLIGDALAQYLRANNCKTLKQVIEGAVQAAIEGNPKALAVIRDSVDGRPPLSVDLNANITVSLAERLEAARRQVKEADEKKND